MNSHGMVNELDGAVSLMRYNPSSYQLRVQVRGLLDEISARLLRLLTNTVETLIKGWYETKVSQSVSCDCGCCKPLDQPISD